MIVFRQAQQSTAFTAANPWTGIPLPVGLIEGDLLILHIASSDNAPSAVPTGYTEVTAGGANGRARGHVYVKIATATEPQPSVSFSAGTDGTATTLAYSGASATIATSSVNTNQGGTAVISAPQITPGTDNCMIIGLFGNRDSANIPGSGLPGAGFTERIDRASPSQNVYNYGEEQLQTAAAAVTPSFTQDVAASTAYVCFSLALPALVGTALAWIKA